MDFVLRLYTRLFTVWVVVFCVLAFYVPEPFVWLGKGMKAFFALTMFGIGAVLSTKDFEDIARRPWLVLLGCCAQYSIMPFGAFAVARVFRFSPEFTVGLVIAGSAPGAMASNVICYIARADTAYSVSLTTVSTLVCPVLTPALVLLLAGQQMPVEYGKMFVDLVLLVVVPLMLGLGLRYLFEPVVKRAERVFPAISVTFIVFICSVVVAGNVKHLQEGPMLVIFVAVLTLNVFGMAMGYGVGSLFRLPFSQRKTLLIEIGMQNAGLGTVLAIKYFGPRAAMPTAMFVIVCIVTAAAVVRLLDRGQETVEVAVPETVE
jgi:BASS family bile acid:Na+ symporter